MTKILSDVAVFGLISGIAYLLSGSRLNHARAKAALYETARRNAGIRR